MSDRPEEGTRYISTSLHRTSVYHTNPDCNKLEQAKDSRPVSDREIDWHGLEECKYCAAGDDDPSDGPVDVEVPEPADVPAPHPRPEPLGRWEAAFAVGGVLSILAAVGLAVQGFLLAAVVMACLGVALVAGAARRGGGRV